MALKDAQGQLDSRGQTYLTFSISDPIEGSLTFYWGDANYSATNAYGGAEVSACVIAWGNLVKYLPDGGSRQNQTVIRLASNAYVTASNAASKRFTVAQVLQGMDIRDVLVTVYQWNAGDSTQEVIWKGYWGGIVGYDFSGGHAAIDVGLSSLERDATETIGTVVNRTDDPNAPNGAFGLMRTKGYGSLVATLDTANESSTVRLDPLALGYGIAAGLTVPTDEAASSTNPSARYVCAQNDGTAASLTSEVNDLVPDGATGDWWIYEPSVGAFAHIDDADIFATANSTAETAAVISHSPAVWFFLRPTTRASSTSAGLTDVQPCLDDNPANYITLDGTNPNLGLECPAISLPSGAEVQEVRIVLDMEHDSGSMDIGLYDAVGAAYAGTPSYQTITTPTIVPNNNERCQFISGSSGGTGGGAIYGTAAFNSEGTLPEFYSGRFVYIDSGSSNQRKPYHIRLARSSGTKKIYSVALAVKVVYPRVKVGEKPITRGVYDPGAGDIIQEQIHPKAFRDVLGAPGTAPGIQVVFTGEYQKDDGSGTITGSAAALITKAPDVARHLVQVIGGKSVNSTSGTLGNFVDQRTEETTGERNITPIFGPGQVFSRTGALNELMAHLPWLKVYPEDGAYQCIVDALNPHSSQAYRSTSDLVEIEPWDIIETFQVEELDSRKFVNKVTVNVGHSYGRNAPVASYTYDNPLSQAYWGASQTFTVDEPWIHVPDLVTGAPEAAKFLARYYGRVAARPRLTVTLGLAQKFYDLRPGHVLQFSKKMEDAGIVCPAYRTGRLDYLYPADGAANQADDLTPTFLSSGGVDRSCVFGSSQLTDSVTFTVTSAGTYTDDATPWEYYNGSSWAALSGVTCSDGGSSASVFERTGTHTVSWTMPTFLAWKKAEITMSSALRGPCYFWRHNADNVTVSATGSGAIATTPVRWWGRLFIVRETNRRAGSTGYPYMEAVLEEVM